MSDTSETTLEVVIKAALGSHVLPLAAYARLALFFLERGFPDSAGPSPEGYCPQRLAHLAVAAAIATADNPESLRALQRTLVDPFSPAAHALRERLNELMVATAA